MTNPFQVTHASLSPESGPYALKIQFADGLVRVVDFGPWLRANASHLIFGLFLDPDSFASFTVEDGELSWGNGQMDFHPSALRSGTISPEPAGGVAA